MNINNRLMKVGFKRSPNLIWDNSLQKYIGDSSKNNWMWTYIYEIEKIEIRAVINRRSLSIFHIDYSKTSKWYNKPSEKCIFSKIDAHTIQSFNEIIKTLPKNIQREIKIRSIL